uniref:Putative homing endonuclease n=2 Tax=viral metagenome TaxID=1070528 RepID=A0A6M3XS12_9ZZZZ
MNFSKRTRKEVRGAIIGMVMGDASLYQGTYRDGSRKGNYLLNMSHSYRQRQYLEHKRDIINDLFDYRLIVRDTIAKAQGKTYPASRLLTRVHPRLSFIAKRIYIDRKKRITQWALDNITDEGLALWWLDDGCLHLNKPPQKGGDMIWGTYGFPKEDVELMRSWLTDKYGINLHILKHKRSGGYYLKRGLSEALKFSEIVRPYTPDSMRYKIAERSMFVQGPYSLSNNLQNSARPPLRGDDMVHACGNAG